MIDPDSRADIINVGGELKERACDSLVMCIVTTLNQGLRNGGGIGDILRAPSSTVSIQICSMKNYRIYTRLVYCRNHCLLPESCTTCSSSSL